MKLQLRYVAAAAALMVGGVASAHTLVVTPGPVATYSRQGAVLSASTANVGIPGTNVTLGADYSVNDNIDFTIAGATVGGTTNANLAVAANIACDDDANLVTPAPLIVSFVARTGNVISLRVTQKNVANTVGVICTIANNAIEVTYPSLATSAGSVTGAWAARTAITNIAFDPQTAPVGSYLLASVIDQFTSAQTTAFNNVVDVNAPSLRTLFTPVANETYVVTATNTNGNSGVNAVPAAANGVVVTVNGNFNFVDTSANGCTNGELAGVIAVVSAPAAGATPTISSDCQTLTITDANAPVAGTTQTYTVTITPPGRVLVAPQTFTSSVGFNYAVGLTTGTESDAYAAGAWTLNGFIAFVSYMPYGANISQIIYLANDSNQTGAVNIAARNSTGVACNFAAGSVSGNRNTVLSGAIKTGLEACYGAAFTDKVQFTLTANIPAADGDLYTAYNVGGNDRGTVVNDSNGK